MRVSVLLINHFAPDILASSLNWQALSSTEDGLSVTVSERKTSVVQFSFYDALRNQAQVKSSQKVLGTGSTVPESENAFVCVHEKHYQTRLDNTTLTAEVDESKMKTIPEFFWKSEPVDKILDYVAMPIKTV